MTQEAEVHVGAPPDDDGGLSPIEQALASLEDGDNEDLIGDQPAGDDDAGEADDSADSGSDEAGDQQGEGEDEDGSGEADDEGGDDDEFVIELPETLKAQGYDDIVVPAEQRELFQALTASYESREQREHASQELQEYEASLMEELEEFRLVAATDPFQLIDKTFNAPGEADETLHLYLMSDPKRWQRHVEFVESVQDAEDAKAAKERLEFNHERRTHRAKLALEAAGKARQAAKMAREHVSKVLDKINADDRDFVKERLFADIRAAAERQRRDTGSDIIDLATVDKLAKPWLQRFGAPNGGPPAKEKPKPASEDEQVAAATDRIRRKAEARKRASKQVPPTGSSPAGPAVVPKGATLDDVVKSLKAGKLKV